MNTTVPARTSSGVPIAPYPAFDGSQTCAQTDVEAYFPEKGESPKAARDTCVDCDFRRPCLAYALTHHEWGVWGGTTERERRELRRRYGLVAVSPARPIAPSAAAHDDQDHDLADTREDHP